MAPVCIRCVSGVYPMGTGPHWVHTGYAPWSHGRRRMGNGGQAELPGGRWFSRILFAGSELRWTLCEGDGFGQGHREGVAREEMGCGKVFDMSP